MRMRINIACTGPGRAPLISIGYEMTTSAPYRQAIICILLQLLAAGSTDFVGQFLECNAGMTQAAPFGCPRNKLLPDGQLKILDGLQIDQHVPTIIEDHAQNKQPAVLRQLGRGMLPNGIGWDDDSLR